MHRVAAAIARYGPIVRTTLAQVLGLSQGTLSRITSNLVYAGVIEELSVEAGPSGKLPKRFTSRKGSDRRKRLQTSLVLRPNARTFIGIKAHGVSIVTAAVNTHGEVAFDRHGVPIRTDQSVEYMVSAITQLVHECSADITSSRLPSPTAVDVVIGGHVVDDSIVTFAPFLHWDGATDLRTMVTETISLPCEVFSDINSLLVDAPWFGSGVGMGIFAVVTTDVGVGYSLTVSGKPVQYPDKSYGLVGHVPIDLEGLHYAGGYTDCSQYLTDDPITEQYLATVDRAASFEDFARDAKGRVLQATQLVSRTRFRLGSLMVTATDTAIPGHVIIAEESALSAKLGISSLRNGTHFYHRSQTQPTKFIIMNRDWQLWAKATTNRVVVKHIGQAVLGPPQREKPRTLLHHNYSATTSNYELAYRQGSVPPSLRP